MSKYICPKCKKTSWSNGGVPICCYCGKKAKTL